MNKVFIPKIPHIFPVTRMVRDNTFVRDAVSYTHLRAHETDS